MHDDDERLPEGWVTVTDVDGNVIAYDPTTFVRLEGGQLDIGIVRECAPWWRPFRRRRLRREARATLEMFAETWLERPR